jgi:hypothetical protein
VPCPVTETLSVDPEGGGGGATSNVAVALWSVSIVSVQSAVPLQSPLQPEKVEPFAAAACRVTTAPGLYVCEQSAVHETDPSVDDTVPDPTTPTLSVAVVLDTACAAPTVP